MPISNAPPPREADAGLITPSKIIRDHLVEEGIFQSDPRSQGASKPSDSISADAISDGGNARWRIAVRPFHISQNAFQFLESLGAHLLSFYQVANRLYFESVRGQAPGWVADYLDQGKPESVVALGRMNRFKQELPGIIRPDLIPGDTGMMATELDAVPGGVGLTAMFQDVYSPFLDKGERMIGQTEGMVEGFERMIRSLSPKKNPCLVIAISDESRAYRSEMAWLAERLRGRGLSCFLAAPGEVQFSEEGLSIKREGREYLIDILYRFFELFDLKNIPKSELILYAAKKKKVILTPPPKAYLEEKSLFALFHHPVLRVYWQSHLGEQAWEVLKDLFPKTWMLDPRVTPPHAIIPDLKVDDRPVSDFRALGRTTQKGRRYVVKPSGFSNLAWGSRGVSVGHDLSEARWAAVIDEALEHFQTTPHILQAFHKGKKMTVEYYDDRSDRLVRMEGRTRLSPYYFVSGQKVCLGGVLATVCSLEKKLIHGMVDAVMAPCAVSAPLSKTLATRSAD
ncbi:MAG: hypothetical protein ACE5GK_05525 [Nitrospiria bacterium]